ncbi:MAG: hypothetical protein HS101_03800 [Planctomycetia bacterium]|nr:hypothetical protein [Planctomycetia bacterium]MCC7316011.1 hypothetical protein [Planctomycetota bacterium]
MPILLCAGGCTLGPTVLRQSRFEYNDAIQRTTDEQLLLNLVRLRHRKSPLFLEVSHVFVRYDYEQSVSLDGEIVENVGPNPITPDTLKPGGSLKFTEKPTLSLSPLQGEEFVTRILSPISIENLILLQRSGWGVDRVFRLGVQRINHLDNASSASGPTPAHPPVYEEFLALSKSLRQLQIRGAIEFGYQSHEVDLAPPVSLDRVRPSDIIEAAEHRCRFRTAEDGAKVVLCRNERLLELSIHEQWRNSPEVIEIMKLLQLTPGRKSYPVEPDVADLAHLSTTDTETDHVSIGTRSLLGVLFYLSQGIECPESQVNDGLIAETRHVNGSRFDWSSLFGDIFRVRSQKMRPLRAAVTVFYRGYWYFIEETDHASLSTFALLSEMFALQAGSAKHAGPIVSLDLGT